jgi:tRNA pseudouridine55 synthase
MVRVSGPSGVLVVDKPTGKTSHDIVAEARRHFRTRAVGHAGTLDPMASGVLLLLFGEATKLSGYLTADDKRYRARVSFGRGTDTLDAEGVTTEERSLAPGWLDSSALEAALSVERDRRQQVPPAYSAIKVGGERAHRLSRQGRPPELPARDVVVHELEVEAFDDAEATLVLSVSKGYFVRSLARDLSETLGVPGHLTALRRLASGGFSLEEAVAWPPSTEPRWLTITEAASRCLPVLELTPAAVVRARQGKPLSEADFGSPPPSGLAAWVAEGRLVAIGQAAEAGFFRVVRGFTEHDLSGPEPSSA